MYLLYVDESGDPGRDGSDFLLLGGAALFEGKWSYVDKDIRDLIENTFPASHRPEEIHFASLYQGKNEYRSLNRIERFDLLDNFCSIVSGMLPTEIVLFTVIADKREWFSRNPGKTGDDLYIDLFEQLTNRFDLFLRRRHAEGSPSKGVVIADPHKPSLSEALKGNQRLFQRQGHRWGAVYNLIETVFFLASNESPGLQIADLCSYGIWRLVTADDDRIARSIHGAFDREPLSSRRNPGKWHGVYFLGGDTEIQRRIDRVWS